MPSWPYDAGLRYDGMADAAVRMSDQVPNQDSEE